LTELPAGLPKGLFEAGDIGAGLGVSFALFGLAAISVGNSPRIVITASSNAMPMAHRLWR